MPQNLRHLKFINTKNLQVSKILCNFAKEIRDKIKQTSSTIKKPFNVMTNVTNLINDNGYAARNQYVIKGEKGVYFQSYNSIIAKVDKRKKITLTYMWDYSNTTRKHLYIFLRQQGFTDLNCKKDIVKAIKEGKITEVQKMIGH